MLKEIDGSDRERMKFIRESKEKELIAGGLTISSTEWIIDEKKPWRNNSSLLPLVY